MKKLSLNLDNLQVESFSTRGAERPRGTVNAHEYTDADPGCTTLNPSDIGGGCSAYYSCYAGCGGGGGGGYYSAGDTCGEETEYVSCTLDYKHCGF